MSRTFLSTLFFVSLFVVAGFSQPGTLPEPVKKFKLDKSTPTLELAQPNMEVIRQEDAQYDRNGFYRIGVAGFTDITPQTAGSWTTHPNGDRVWQLHIKYPGAEALSFLFSRFKLYDQAKMDVYDVDGLRLHRQLTAADVLEHFQQHIALCFGDEMTLQLTEPVGTRASDIHLEQIMYGYRGTGNPNQEKDFGESESCEVNVNCSPVGTPWQDEKRGVARILVVIGNVQGWCSGSLVNNTARDCKPLFLTAMHCMINNAGTHASTSNFNNWRFYFGFEAAGCPSPGSAGTLDDHYITGCVKLAYSNDEGGQSGSDFLLVQLGALANQAAVITTLKSANFNAYWNGWDANTAAATGGAGIHHPNGDIKKISTFIQTTITSGWDGNGLASHWRFSWTANANGYGVTEGGSSGSPIFNNSGRIFGTLTGGGSFCETPSANDYYGKMSYHWISNGTPSDERLKTFLDPGNSGLLVMDGSSNPCAPTNPPPVANFSGTPTTVTVGNVVQFTDLTSNAPTSWSWQITPASGWSYASGTNANSQHPQVTFTTPGQYTIELTASNSQGSDTETKVNYITATLITGPCVATSTTCDEFINNVNLGSINNTSGCDNYEFFPSQTTALTQGQMYTLTIIPQNGTTVGQAYVNDEIAAWIDWNNDMDFDDAGERIAYVLVASGWNNFFNFNVPTTSATGQLHMRVRISYNGADNPDGPITPCGTTEFGEVEDYIVSVVPVLGVEETSLFAGVAVFPNPVSETLSIDLSTIDAPVSIELLDLTGKVIATQQHVEGTIARFELNHLAKGSYQVRLISGNNKAIRKVVKL